MIKVHSFGFTYPGAGRPAVRGVSFTVELREILGPSGAGMVVRRGTRLGERPERRMAPSNSSSDAFPLKSYFLTTYQLFIGSCANSCLSTDRNPRFGQILAGLFLAPHGPEPLTALRQRHRANASAFAASNRAVWAASDVVSTFACP